MIIITNFIPSFLIADDIHKLNLKVYSQPGLRLWGRCLVFKIGGVIIVLANIISITMHM